MAVYTKVAADKLDAWLEEHAGLHLAGDPEPVTEGIENTNFSFAASDGRRYVFTVLEVWDMPRAEYCVSLSRHLHAAGQPVPEPIALKSGHPCAPFAGKPAVAVAFASGRQKRQPDAQACKRIGETMAGLHGAAAGFAPVMPNARDAAWRESVAPQLASHMAAADRQLLERALVADRACSAADLPQAACHCDLFRNNVLWNNSSVEAVIDFYFAGHDRLLFDLAVAAVDWCFDDLGALDQAKLDALAAGYASGRRLLEEEARVMPAMCAAAALRFWLSRLYDMHHPRPSSLLVEHDPAAFRLRLASCLDHSADIHLAFG